MGEFRYFLPNVNQADAAALDAAGLGYAFEGVGVDGRQVGRGPDDQAGVVVAQSAAANVYEPDVQTWERIEGNEVGAWLGYVPDDMPGPGDLERDNGVAQAYSIKADAGRWFLPAALMADGSCGLPKTRTMDGAGGIVRRCKRAYVPLYLEADRVLEALNNGAKTPEREETEIAVRALAAVYRVRGAECEALELLTDDAIPLILRALVDWPNRKHVDAE